MARGGTEQRCIEGLVAVYERALDLRLLQLPKPDLQSDRKRPDALLVDEQGCRLAIEHKLFQLVQRQAELEAKWRKAIAGLRKRAPDGLFVYSVVMLRGLSAPWAALRSDLEEWAAGDLSQLRPGEASVLLARSGLAMTVQARTSNTTGWIIRPQPDLGPDWSPEAQAPRLRDRIAEVADKFSSELGARRAFLLQGDDAFNTTWEHYYRLAQAVVRQEPPSGIDDLWLVETMPDQSGAHFYTALWSAHADAVAAVWSTRWSLEHGLGAGINLWPDGLRG